MQKKKNYEGVSAVFWFLHNALTHQYEVIK